MSRTPAYLAALASAAVPGLDPVAAQVVHLQERSTGPLAAVVEPEVDSAYVIDAKDRRWVVRAPRTITAGARMESALALLALLARRVDVALPVPIGFATIPEGRATVSPVLPGRPLHLPGLPAGPGLAAHLGSTLAAVHNLDRRLFEEAGVPVYEADEQRTRRLADLDRAASTGHVPTALLSRWENALDDVTLWRFAPTPIHGSLTGTCLLAQFESDDATSGQITAITGWEEARIADPAEDLAAIVTEAPEAAVECVLEAYAQARAGAVDSHLVRRARLASELRLLGALLTATTSGRSSQIRAAVADLRRLEEGVDVDDLAAPAPPVVASKPIVVPASAQEDRAPDDLDATGAFFDLRNVVDDPPGESTAEIDGAAAARAGDDVGAAPPTQPVPAPDPDPLRRKDSGPS